MYGYVCSFFQSTYTVVGDNVLGSWPVDRRNVWSFDSPIYLAEDIDGIESRKYSSYMLI
jgi:hypothetical protein